MGHRLQWISRILAVLKLSQRQLTETPETISLKRQVKCPFHHDHLEFPNFCMKKVRMNGKATKPNKTPNRHDKTKQRNNATNKQKHYNQKTTTQPHPSQKFIHRSETTRVNSSPRHRPNSHHCHIAMKSPASGGQGNFQLQEIGFMPSRLLP